MSELSITESEARTLDKRLKKNAAATLHFLTDARRMKDTKGYSLLGYKTWEDYATKAIGYTPQHLNSMLKIKAVVERVAPKSEDVSSLFEPNHTQAAALSEAPEESQADIWQEVVEEHGENVTAAVVSEAVAAHAEEPEEEPDLIDAILADKFFADSAKQINAIRKGIKTRFEDPLYQPYLKTFAVRIDRDLGACRNTLSMAQPAERCRHCDGAGCTRCVQTGYATKLATSGKDAKR